MRLRTTIAALIGICLAACATAPTGNGGGDRPADPVPQEEN